MSDLALTNATAAPAVAKPNLDQKQHVSVRAVFILFAAGEALAGGSTHPADGWE